MLSTADILNLIRLTELEILKLQKEIEGENEVKKNEAGELIVQFDSMAQKLRSMYIESKPDYDVFPQYDAYIQLISE
ncbi:MAG: hypothetical protein ACI93R_001259 [Flavobacteriales bacterium]|jgi:hypothetical protein